MHYARDPYYRKAIMKKLLITTALLARSLLASESNPCFGPKSTDETRELHGKILSLVIYYETTGNYSDALEALKLRRMIRLGGGVKCYNHEVENAIGRSPITGE